MLKSIIEFIKTKCDFFKNIIKYIIVCANPYLQKISDITKLNIDFYTTVYKLLIDYLNKKLIIISNEVLIKFTEYKILLNDKYVAYVIVIKDSISLKYILHKLAASFLINILIVYCYYTPDDVFIYLHIVYYYNIIVTPLLFLNKKIIKNVVLLFLLFLIMYIIYSNTDIIEAFIKIYFTK